jgi:ATP-dependent DNA helicase RecG
MTPWMRDLMKEAGLKEPVFEPDTFFRAIFHRDPEYSLKPATDLRLKKRVVGKGVEGVVEKLSLNQHKIFETIAKDPAVSAQTLSEIVGISHRKIQKNIAKLKDRGLLKRVGHDKGGHWKILV